MKHLVKVEEIEGEGLVKLMGEHVMLFCLNYIYAGTLVGVNDKFILLEDASIVYETGELKAKTFKDAQLLPTKTWYVKTDCVESYGVSGR